ncbi:hypothetical protein PAEPH01_1542 [Pancytospora epiphaga]|nr:hypothetical protein PAEPH01_1542 [Pancytospora epiphaga]
MKQYAFVGTILQQYFKENYRKKLYNARENKQASVVDSSVWLKHGNEIFARQSRVLCYYLHICNVFRKEIGTCPYCKKRPKTVDHLATQCDRMLYHDYTRRHNEVVRCIRFEFKYIIYMYYHPSVHSLSKR